MKCFDTSGVCHLNCDIDECLVALIPRTPSKRALAKAVGEYPVRCDPPCENRAAKTSHVMRAYRDGMHNAARLVRGYEIENNKSYRERIAKFLEEKAK